MSHAKGSTTYTFQAEHLPVWWRYLLVAVAVVILCSCSSPAIRTHLAADNSLANAPPAAESPTANSDALVNVSDLPVNQPIACQQYDRAPNGAASTDPYGPVVGPSDEYLCDGGDYGTPAGVKADWTIEGLEPEDAIGHYDTVDGRVIVTPSNRVCIYAPRFAAVRRVVEAAAHEQPIFVNATLEETGPAKATKALPPLTAKQRHGVAIDFGQRPPSLFRQRQQAGGLENLQASMDAYTSLAAYANLEIIRTGEVSDAEKPRLERAMQSAVYSPLGGNGGTGSGEGN